jgi:S1-C subfamily serine protease
MCGLGACGCIWASLHNIDVAWGGAGLAEPDERGIPLRSPPRSGSQLAAAGVQQWDRIVSVDDEPVRSPGELQAALRRHAIGEEVRLRIDLDDESREIVVRHASDLP